MKRIDFDLIMDGCISQNKTISQQTGYQTPGYCHATGVNIPKSKGQHYQKREQKNANHFINYKNNKNVRIGRFLNIKNQPDNFSPRNFRK